MELKRLELESERLEMEKTFCLKELGLKAARPSQAATTSEVSAGFDVSRNICLVPPFREKDVDKYFTHFERVAKSLGWPKCVWTLLLQCVLSGKAQEVYSSLSFDQSSDFEAVKTAILRSYEFVPEAYRQKF